MRHYLRKEFFRQLAQLALQQAGIDRDHLAAHGLFVHISGFVVFVAWQGLVNDPLREEPALDLPVEKVRAGIARPERAVAIEDCKLGAKGQDRLDELLGFQGKRGLGIQDVDPACNWSRSSGVSILTATNGSSTAR